VSATAAAGPASAIDLPEAATVTAPAEAGVNASAAGICRAAAAAAVALHGETAPAVTVGAVRGRAAPGDIPALVVVVVFEAAAVAGDSEKR